jgi:hypothetical protein
MKSSSKTFNDKFHNYGQRESWSNLLIKGFPYVLTSLLIVTILSFFFLYSPNSLTLVPNQSHDEIIENHSQKQEHEHANTFVPNKHDIIEEHQRAKISTLPPSKPHKGMFQNDHIHIQS